MPRHKRGTGGSSGSYRRYGERMLQLVRTRRLDTSVLPPRQRNRRRFRPATSPHEGCGHWRRPRSAHAGANPVVVSGGGPSAAVRRRPSTRLLRHDGTHGRKKVVDRCSRPRCLRDDGPSAVVLSDALADTVGLGQRDHPPSPRVPRRGHPSAIGMPRSEQLRAGGSHSGHEFARAAGGGYTE